MSTIMSSCPPTRRPSPAPIRVTSPGTRSRPEAHVSAVRAAATGLPSTITRRDCLRSDLARVGARPDAGTQPDPVLRSSGDQSAPHGLLSKIRDTGMPLIPVIHEDKRTEPNTP